MAAGGRNPQKSAMARAKRQAADAQKSKGGGGSAAIAERRGAGMADKMDATAQRKAEVEARKVEKAKKEEEKLAREAREKEKFLREEEKKKKAAAGGGAAAAGGELEALEKKVRPTPSPPCCRAVLCCVCTPHLSALLYAQQLISARSLQLMPLVKKGDTAQASGDLQGALALYQEAMDGFRTNGFKRPKLKEKLDACKELIAAAPPAMTPREPEPAVDQSVEIAEDEC